MMPASVAAATQRGSAAQKDRPPRPHEKARIFGDSDEVILAHQDGRVLLHDPIKVKVNGEVIETTVGRIVFNDIIPPEMGFINHAMDKRALEQLVGECHRTLGPYRTSLFLDSLKEIQWEFVTRCWRNNIDFWRPEMNWLYNPMFFFSHWFYARWKHGKKATIPMMHLTGLSDRSVPVKVMKGCDAIYCQSGLEDAVGIVKEKVLGNGR